MQPEQSRYQDDETSFAEEAASSDKDSSPSFPQQLMEVLSNERLSDIVSWLPHGQGWIIHDKKRFAIEVLPAYFEKKSKWTSFTRKLNRWNFTRVTRGDEVGAYYHPLFKRENKELCLQMNCLGSKMAQSLEPLNPVALGLATPKMIEHGLLSGMVPRRSLHSTTKKKKATTPSQQQDIAPPLSSSATAPSSSSSLFYFQSQQPTDPRTTTTPLPPSSITSASLQFNPQLHNFSDISIPSTATMNRQATQEGTTPGYVEQQQAFFGTIGNPLSSSTYSGMVLPELRDDAPHTRQLPSANPLLAFVNAATFLQPTPIAPLSSFASSWAQQTTTESLFSNHLAQPQPSFASHSTAQQQQQHQDMVAYIEELKHRINTAASQQQHQDDMLTLTPIPAMSSHSVVVETPSQPTSRRLVQVHQPDGTTGQAWSPDDSGQDVSPSIFDTTSSSSDQGSGVHHHHHHHHAHHPPPPQGSSSSETSPKKLSPASIMANTILVQTPPVQHGQLQLHHEGGGSGGRGPENASGSSSSNIVNSRSLPGSVVAAIHHSRNQNMGGGGGGEPTLARTSRRTRNEE